VSAIGASEEVRSKPAVKVPTLQSFGWLSSIADARVQFPLIAAVLLAVIWITTFSVIDIERDGAQHAAATSSQELLSTYEAQAVRALGEIDQTLKLVRYAFQENAGRDALTALEQQTLLPPDLVFTVGIADADGNLVASTGAASAGNVATSDYFKEQRDGDGTRMAIGRLPQGASGDSKLIFSRRLNNAHGEFDGIAMVSVDAAYFVSGYEETKLGVHGVLGLLGVDGVFRVRRSGEAVFAGDPVDYESVLAAAEQADGEPAKVFVNSWDGVRRYTSARELYDFPLAVIVGLSEGEQLAAARANIRSYVQRAIAASVLVVLLSALLGRMSWQLAQSRKRESDARIAHAERVEYLAYHDGLTGLPNRSLFSRLLAQSIAQAHRHTRQMAVAFLDLDRFKQINDTLGHEAGDELLKEVGRRLASCVRDSDTVARLGGDEFVVLLPELTEDHYAATVARKILAAVAHPFVLIGQEFRVTASIGICIYPQDGLDEQTLTKHADIAMYQAKGEGKNNFQFYSEKLNANSLERLTLESSLRLALERNEFRLLYQAKRDIGSGQITGMEALLRWEHPQLGTVEPRQFIPIAEDTGLIVPIGKWVLTTACQQNVSWQKQDLPRLNIAVNLTARQFVDDGLLADLGAILENTGMDPTLLELEINESLLTANVERTLQIMRALKGMGIRIAIDDFGTGYSSLSMLQRFPLDTIKIDRSFIRGVDNAATNRDLTDAVITVGKALSLTVVAQGVETKEQADYLRQHSCDELQGFYFARAVPADEATRLLKAQSPDITYIGTRAALRNT
jgi:diguanylate cyclase (GGDEF)-like protein